MWGFGELDGHGESSCDRAGGDSAVLRGRLNASSTDSGPSEHRWHKRVVLHRGVASRALLMLATSTFRV